MTEPTATDPGTWTYPAVLRVVYRGVASKPVTLARHEQIDRALAMLVRPGSVPDGIEVATEAGHRTRKVDQVRIGRADTLAYCEHAGLA